MKPFQWEGGSMMETALSRGRRSLTSSAERRDPAGFEVNDPQYESELITSVPARVESCW